VARTERGAAREVVIDASVVLRRLIDQSPEAEDVLRRDALVAPALIVPETVNGLATQVRFGRLLLEDALALYEDYRGLPIDLVPDAALAADGLAVAQALDLSAYDASYVVLAERLKAPLVTADARLAERYPRSELIP
jgi:predicted nucleic acid-binding protein